MKLYFGNKNKERRLICTATDNREIRRNIANLLDEWGWECDFSHVSKISDTEIKIDVGSWYEFFYVEMENKEEMKQWF